MAFMDMHVQQPLVKSYMCRIIHEVLHHYDFIYLRCLRENEKNDEDWANYQQTFYWYAKKIRGGDGRHGMYTLISSAKEWEYKENPKLL